MWRCDIVDGRDLDVDEVAELYRASTLAARRPVEQRERFATMIREANLVVTARLDGQLIGIARALTDYGYVTYLSDIAVDQEFQRRGVGKDLIRVTQEAAPDAKIVLLSAPGAASYYPHVGFERHDSAWELTAYAGVV